MIYLILAIACSAMVSIIVRLSEGRVKNNISMLSMNYMMCIILAGYYMGAFKMLSESRGDTTTVLMGMVNGLLYLLGFVLLQVNIKENGVVLSATFMKLGVLVPTTAAILCFGEKPTAIQVLGFVIAIIAIVTIHFEKEQSAIAFRMGLILLLLAGGGGDAMSKVYEEVGSKKYEEHFLFYTFVSAFVLCVILAVVKKQRLAKEDIFFGLLVGIPNYYSARFLLKSLGPVPAIVAYPTYSVATIVVVSVVGVVAFKEKMSARRGAAIGMILVALVMLNV